MKKYTLIITLLFILNDSFAQNYIITYKIKKDTTNFKHKDKKIEAILNSKAETVYEIVKDYSFILKFNSNESIYQIQDYLDSDSYSEMDINLAKLLGGGESIYYQNKNTNQKIINYKMSNQYINEVDTLTIPWKITTMHGKIGKYNVYKAVYNNIEAWFTPDIPVPFGPIGYGGLPGLILKIKLGKRIIYADKIKITKQKIVIKKPKGIDKSHKELKKKRMEEMMNNLQRQRK